MQAITIHPETFLVIILALIIIVCLLGYWAIRWSNERKEEKKGAKVVHMDLDSHEQELGGL